MFLINVSISMHCCFTAYGDFLKSQGETPVTWQRVQTVEEVLRLSDVVGYMTKLMLPFCNE